MAFKDQTEKFYTKEHNIYLILNNTCSSRSFVLKTLHLYFQSLSWLQFFQVKLDCRKCMIQFFDLSNRSIRKIKKL
jgi:hypothetical protein